MLLKRQRRVAPFALLLLLVSTALLAALNWNLIAASAGSAPQTQGISVANPEMPAHGYLGPGDHLYFKVRLNRELRPTVVTPEMTAGTYFYFRYTNTSNPATLNAGHLARKAELYGIGQDADGHYLLYRHTILAGASSDGTNRLYFAGNRAEVHSSLCAKHGNNDCERLDFRTPADGAALGAARIAAGGSWAGNGRADPGIRTNLENAIIVDPPADGQYHAGDVVTVRLEYNGRLRPLPPGHQDLAGHHLLLHIGPNHPNDVHAEMRDRPEQADSGVKRVSASMHQTGNSGDTGFAEFRYTVAAGDSDNDGLEIENLVPGPAGNNICPEVIGPGCVQGSVGLVSRGKIGVLSGISLYGSALVWRNASTTLSFLKLKEDPGQGVGYVHSPDGNRIFYRLMDPLPRGLRAFTNPIALGIGGAPLSVQSSTPYRIKAFDLKGRAAIHTVNIEVELPPPPAFPAGTYNLSVWQDDITVNAAGGTSSATLQLPKAEHGTGDLSYTIAGKPDWISYVQSGEGSHRHHNPGTVSVSSLPADGAATSATLTLTATDEDRRQTQLSFVVSIKTRPIVGAPRATGDTGGYWLRGSRIVIEVPVENGPVTIAGAKPQMSLSFGWDDARIHNTRTATYIGAEGAVSVLRFGYNTTSTDNAYATGSVGVEAYLRAGAITGYETVKDGDGNAMKPPSDSNANLLGNRTIRGDSFHPAFEQDSYVYEAWADEDFLQTVPKDSGRLTSLKRRMFYGGTELPAASPASATAAPYTLSFRNRQLSWPKDGAGSGSDASVTLKYQVYMPAAVNPTKVDAVFAETEITVNRQARPVPQSVTVTLPAGKTALTEGDTIVIDVTFDRNVKILPGANPPAVNLMLGGQARTAAITEIRNGTVARANYAVTGTDPASTTGFSVPDEYLSNPERLTGDRVGGNPARATIVNSADITVPTHQVVQGSPEFEEDVVRLTVWNTPGFRMTLASATSPNGAISGYRLLNPSDKVVPKDTPETDTDLKFDPATRVLSREKGPLGTMTGEWRYTLEATDALGVTGTMNVRISFKHRREAQSVTASFGDAGNQTGNAWTGDVITLTVQFDGNVVPAAGLPAPKIKVQIGSQIKELELAAPEGRENDLAKQSRLVAKYTPEYADLDVDGISLPSGWLVNPESIASDETPDAGQTSYNTAYDGGITALANTGTGTVTVNARPGYKPGIVLPELTIISNREYNSDHSFIYGYLNNAFPAPQTVGQETTITVAGLPPGMENTRSPNNPQIALTGTYSDPDRSENGTTFTAKVQVFSGSTKLGGETNLKVRIVPDLEPDYGDKTAVSVFGGQNYLFRPGEKIRIVYRNNQALDLGTAAVLPAFSLSLDGQARTAAYNAAASETSTGTYVFEYAVTAADRTNNGPCIITGMTGGWPETMIRMPASGKIPLAGCRVDPGAPSFAVASSETPFVVAKDRSGTLQLPTALGGIGAVSYGIATDYDYQRSGQNILAWRSGVDYQSESNTAQISPLDGKENRHALGMVTRHLLTATDTLGRTSTYSFLIRTVDTPIPATDGTGISLRNSRGQETESSGYTIGEAIVVTVEYQRGYAVAAAEDTAYIELKIGSNVRKAYAEAKTVAQNKDEKENRTVTFKYVVRADDAGAAGGISLNEARIKDCRGLTGYTVYSENRPSPALYPMDEVYGGCPLPPIPANNLKYITITMDKDGDGLIEIGDPEQLKAAGLDPDGDGRPETAEAEYAAAFPRYLRANPKCGAVACQGYELVKSLDLSGIDLGYGLGNESGNAWTAVFDGNGHALSGISIDPGAGAEYVGLFQEIGPGGVVRNLGLIRPKVKGAIYVGAIAGANAGKIEKVYVADGEIEATTYWAGIIAGTNGADINGDEYESSRIVDFWATGKVAMPADSGPRRSDYRIVGENFGIVRYGWVDVFEDGETVPSSHGLGTWTGVWEINQSTDSRQAGTGNRPETRERKTLEGADASELGWSNPGSWDFGGEGKLPVLKGAGFDTRAQRELAGSR